MKVPTQPIPLMMNIFRDVLPTVHRYYDQWKERAELIPDPELRAQALDALERKEFHCEGGGIYGLLARDRFDELIQFIIAYQIMCDYLDNLCDQSDYLDPKDFRSLHNALLAALTPGEPLVNYYQYRVEQEDGGYLHELIETCQHILVTFPSFRIVQDNMLQLSKLYGDLQVHKHVVKEERIPRLEAWFEEYKNELPEMTWFEFSACTGSTLGIYSLATYGTKEGLTEAEANVIKDGYYPWVQGVHLLLDYFIDQEEDIADDELNFLFYYDNDEQMIERFQYFVKQAEQRLSTMPDPKFHRQIWRGIIAIYLSDSKVQKNKELKKKSKQMIKMGGLPTFLFYLNSWIYRRDRSS
ncbi:tetraprenyl-beta-curcumene synthase family protein [Alkalihalobacillus pseudalcaliphilus]|uniref:tetraprenyl-beta-curcumene synthase family protein n=1 Tax=Alkalihalobacillus pseudalcaliphilus TaxID=79884 RepID=UPI00064DA349|nr:tetraprenyl-beta-curcumene synthase family protein [Alkalihalobacillus pseudalcaliphilus]KMK77781.1 tetraprenyl-beta-curcumene synthase [Alkalihalobacillus pseudalcaliphilus]